MATYTFSIQNNFPNQLVATDRLTQEIQASAIVTVLDRIDVAGDVCNVVFKAALSPGDETLLNAIVAAHTGAPLPATAVPVTVANLQKTVDDRLAVRTSSTNRMQNYKLRAISFYTSDLVGGLHNINPVTGLTYGDMTISLFDTAGDPIVLEANEGNAVKTVLDFEPTYDYEIIGGFMDIPSILKDGVTDLWYASAIGVPDYTPQQYGSIDFISEINLEAVMSQRIVSDGRAISFMPYNLGGAPHTNRLRLIVKHPVGVKKRFQFCIEHFTP